MTMTEYSSVEELHDKLEVVEVVNGVIIATEKRPESPPLGEIGSTGKTKWGGFGLEEYNYRLAGRQGLQQYNKMRRSDGQVIGLLRLLKTPILAARWYVTPGGSRRKDKQIADFVTQALWKEPTSRFPQTMSEILTMMDFGFSAFEKVWEFRQVKGFNEPKVVLRKLAQRHALDVDDFEYDSHGGPLGLKMWANHDVFIPIEKLLVFTYEKEGGDMRGVSVLRPAYKHWYYKENLYKIDAIQKERHGIGVPVIKLAAGYGEEDKKYAAELGRNLRTNENAHVVLPPNWELEMLKLEGSMTDALKSIEHHDTLMARGVLGQFLNSDAASSISDFMDLFLKSTRFVADNIREVFNQYLIPELVGWNFTGNYELPELSVRRLGDTVDWRTISFAVRNFVGAGIMIPDEELEAWVRREMDLPLADPSSQRFTLDYDTPQGGQLPQGEDEGGDGPPKAGLPRQSKAGNMRRTAGSNGRVGRDGSRS
jgi:hypothetical protein